MSGFETLALVASAVGTVVKVIGAISQGNTAADAAQAQARYQAQVAEAKGKEEFAAGQRRMLEVRRRKELAQSQLQARAAAGGGDTTDPTVVNLGAGIEGQGEYQALTEFYKGENAQRGYQDAAAAAIWQGDVTASQAQSKAMWDAGGSLLSGITSFGSQYNKLYPSTGGSGATMQSSLPPYLWG